MEGWHIIVSSRRPKNQAALPPPGRLQRVKSFFMALLLTALLVGFVLAAIFLGSIIAAVVIITIVVAGTIAAAKAFLSRARRP